MRFHIRASDSLVETWTSRHVPFRGHTRNTAADMVYRAALREKIRGMRASSTFSASYACAVWPEADIENLLLYNISIGKAEFGDRRSLCFEKLNSDQMPPCSELPDAVAYARYDIGKPSIPIIVDTIVSSEPVAFTIRDLKSAGLMWRVFKAAEWHTGVRHDDGAPLKLDMIIHAPERVNLIGIVKPVLDGFLSALHHRSAADADLPDIIERLALKYGWRDREEIRYLLLDERHAVLGNCGTPQRHIVRRLDSVKWSPDDHRVSHCRIRCEISSDGIYRIEGRLLA